MKTSAIILGLLLSANCTKGQSDTTISFEGVSTLIQIDTSYADNIWQIGSPNKVVFDSAYSAPNTIVTDTVAFYPVNNLSSFTLQIPFLNSIDMVDVNFRHKYDTQAGQDGGYIELSCDSGNTWHILHSGLFQEVDSTNIPYDAYIYSESDTLYNGKPAFSGQSTEWDWGNISFPCMVAKTDMYCLLRFTFSSDSVDSQHDGWMIDDISIMHIVCSGIEETTRSNVSISPNPISDKAVFQLLEDLQVRDGLIEVFDSYGRIVDTRKGITGNRFEYNVNGIKSGIYSYRLVDGDNFLSSGKFVVK